MLTKHQITITIDSIWGTGYQVEFAVKALQTLVKAWETFMLSHHKQNKIDIIFLHGKFDRMRNFAVMSRALTTEEANELMKNSLLKNKKKTKPLLGE